MTDTQRTPVARVPQRAPTAWTEVDRDHAYGTWKTTGSIDRTSATTGIPIRTLAEWCRKERWVARREQEDELERAMALQRAFVKVVGKVDPMIDEVIKLALSGVGDKEEEVRRKHLAYALSLVGIAPVQRRVVTDDRPPEISVRALSMEDRAALDAILTEPA